MEQFGRSFCPKGDNQNEPDGSSHCDRQHGRTREAVTLRLDEDALKRLQAIGPDWQRRLNDHLRSALDTLEKET